MNFDELIRYRERQRNKFKFNIIGFSNSEPVKYKHCIFCAGRRLQPDPHDDSKLMCFSCGYSVLAQDAPNEEGVSVKHEKQQTAIVSGKRKKKYYDKQGNEINDPDLIELAREGYVYFTTDLDQAIMYGLRKSLLDMQFLAIPENMKLNPNYRDVVVIAVDESKLGGLEMDPGSSPTFTEATHYGKIIIFPQYRYKGNIKLKDLFLYKHRPFDTFSSNTINEMKRGVHNYRKACNTLMQEKQRLDSSSSFLDVLGVMDKVRSICEGLY